MDKVVTNSPKIEWNKSFDDDNNLLHLSDEYNKPLSWNSRIKIALGSAHNPL